MTTEAEALANILAWSADSPGWQRDALRRLATQAALEPAEIDELVDKARRTLDLTLAGLKQDGWL